MKMKIYILALAFTFVGNVAFADCTNPAGVEGEMMYNSSEKTLQYCDGTTWHDMKAIQVGLLNQSILDTFAAWLDEKFSA